MRKSWMELISEIPDYTADVTPEQAVAAAKAARREVARLRKALKPFAQYVDKQTCTITMIWQDGDYKSTYTNTLKPDHFFAAAAALTPAEPHDTTPPPDQPAAPKPGPGSA